MPIPQLKTSLLLIATLIVVMMPSSLSGLTSKPTTAITNSLPNIASPTPSSCNILGFDPVVHYGVGGGPRAVVSADFNNDGTLDLATANQFSNTVSILLGVGDGSFGAATDFNAGNSPVGIVAGDFNSDGKLDLAVSNLNSQSLSVLLGNGDGTFGPPVSYGAGSYPVSIAVADFNNDGKLDLAVTNSDDTISVLLGNGNGTFGAAVNYHAGSGGTTALAVGDFNADGNADLVVTSVGNDDVSILLGVGDGTFRTAVNYRADNQPFAVAVGDFNADGKLDLAVANSDSADVSILLGVGDGTFGAPVNYGVGSYPVSVALGDFDIDGKLDLAVVNQSSDNISILLGAGNGSFGAAINYSIGNVPYQVAVGDFNADGRLDIATANSNGDDLSVMLNGTTCNTATPTPIVTDTPSPTPPNGCTDVYEPDNDPAHATTSPENSYAHHSFCRSVGQPNNDQDWVEFGGYGGTTFDMGTSNLGISADTVITLYDENLNVIASDDDSGGGRASYIHYQMPAGSLLYLEVVNKSGQGGYGSDYGYDLYVFSPGCATPTPTYTPHPNSASYATSATHAGMQPSAPDPPCTPPTYTPTWTPTSATTITPTSTATSTPTSTSTATPALTSTLTATPLLTDTPSSTPTATPPLTSTPTATPMLTATPTAILTLTSTPVNATQTPTATVTSTCLDQYEPDNDPAHAQIIGSGHHTFCRTPNYPNNDVDWLYENWAPACYIYNLSTQAQGISARTVMTLYDGSLNVLQTSGGPNGWAQINFLECGGTTYYVAVTNYDGTGGFDPNYGYDLLLNLIHVTPVPPSPTPTYTPTDCANPFVDVQGDTFYPAIHYLNCRGVINGTDAIHYTPGSTATRGQFAKIVVLGFGLSLYTPNGNPDFTDVPPSYFAYTYIETGYHAAILSGFDAATCIAAGATPPCYLPNRAITRGQLTKLVVNAAHYPLYTPTSGPTFSDVPPSNVFYVSIETAANKGVVSGYPDHSFHPNNNIRRDEMAQIVYKGVTTP